jgi:two-component system OmpR family response regulator
VKILVVEDDKKVGAFLQKAFTEEGFVVDRVRTTTEAMSQAAMLAYDLLVVDWMLPDGDGLSLCRSLRGAGLQTPILMLTARSETAEKVLALNTGADDYMTKPFSLEELIARSRALIRRSSSGGPMQVRIGELVLDLRTRMVMLAGVRLDLTSKEFVLLEFLARNAPRVVTRSELLANVWHSTADPGSNVIEVHVKNLREKLGTMGERIETVRAQGYRLTLPSDT